MILATLSGLVILLGLVLGAALGALLVHLVRAAPPPVQEARDEELSQLAARKAVDEVLSRLR